MFRSSDILRTVFEELPMHRVAMLSFVWQQNMLEDRKMLKNTSAGVKIKFQNRTCDITK